MTRLSCCSISSYAQVVRVSSLLCSRLASSSVSLWPVVTAVMPPPAAGLSFWCLKKVFNTSLNVKLGEKVQYRCNIFPHQRNEWSVWWNRNGKDLAVWDEPAPSGGSRGCMDVMFPECHPQVHCYRSIHLKIRTGIWTFTCRYRTMTIS